MLENNKSGNNKSDIPAADITPVRRALLSVSDKAGISDFARQLVAAGCELVSTGGTATLLRDEGLPVRDVSELTNFPEMMDGRVKTLHPNIHGGLLALRDNQSHLSAMADHNILPIDLLVVNLYPFEQTVAAGGDYETCVENIDIGGPAMIRAAAKNHGHVGVVTHKDDYEQVLEEIRNQGGLTGDLKKILAARAYARTAHYDAAISNWFAQTLEQDFPRNVSIAGTLASELRYGENPHQKAALYLNGDQRAGVARAKQLQGKALSYNNLNDTDAAFECIAEFDREVPTVAIIKHANPCGVARGKTGAEAYKRALKCDLVSAFGGIIALNQPLDAQTAEEITQIFTEVIIAPGVSDEAREIIAAKKNLRLLITDGVPDPTTKGQIIRPIAGGFLMQSRDHGQIVKSDLKTVTKRAPTEQELNDLVFAFKVAKHVKSNAIVYVKEGATVGVGAGQMSRLDSSRIAARKSMDAAQAAGETNPLVKGSVVASDAFFPFADGLLAAANAGATAVIQPGGSMRDDEVIAAADEAGLAMVFTGMRHFRH